MDFSDFHDSFFEEAEELLAEAEQHLLDLDLSSPDAEQMNAIFRAAHSIKGGAGAFGFTAMQETTHLLENLLDHARHGQLAVRRELVDVFLNTKDILQDQIVAYRQGQEPDQAVFTDICATLKRIEAAEMSDISSTAPFDTDSSATADGKVARAERVEREVLDGYQEDPELEPLQRIACTLKYLAESASAAAATLSPASADKPDEEEAIPRHQWAISFLNVAEGDRELLLAELRHLGVVTRKAGDETRYTVVLESTEEADSIEAVMCFIIEPEQLEITPASASATALDKGNLQTNASPEERQEVKEASSRQNADGRQGSHNRQSSIRVSVDKVDQIINLVGELIITQSMLDQSTQQLAESGRRQLLSGLSQLQRTSRDLQEAVMSIRMLPMDFVFNRYPRQVRDLAAKLNKEVELITEGKSTELDKGLIEKIIDPLTHLVRNSLDHGIELPEVREAAGKPRCGKLMLSARHCGGNIIIEVSDDGAGLNREKLLSKACEKGISVSDDMSDEDVWQLIFAPGFSTAEAVSDVSGRGVGMDVVKRNIQSLGGQVEILSTPGKGTSTRVVLPLTLAILDGMSVRVGDEMFVLPLSAISELVQPKAQDLFSMAGDDQLLKVRDEYLPVVMLCELLGVPGAKTDLRDMIAVIVADEERSYALLVDEPVGQQQVVVKSLEDNYRKVPGVSAATILGNGQVALILDPVGLHRAEQVRKKFRSSQKQTVTEADALWEVAAI